VCKERGERLVKGRKEKFATGYKEFWMRGEPESSAISRIDRLHSEMVSNYFAVIKSEKERKEER
jgi:hypothetical protein